MIRRLATHIPVKDWIPEFPAEDAENMPDMDRFVNEEDLTDEQRRELAQVRVHRDAKHKAEVEAIRDY